MAMQYSSISQLLSLTSTKIFLDQKSHMDNSISKNQLCKIWNSKGVITRTTLNHLDSQQAKGRTQITMVSYRLTSTFDSVRADNSSIKFKDCRQTFFLRSTANKKNSNETNNFAFYSTCLKDCLVVKTNQAFVGKTIFNVLQKKLFLRSLS